MKLRSVILAPVTILTAVCVFFLLQTTNTGKGPIVGINQASACTDTSNGHNCLPHLTFLDTDGEGWTHENLHGQIVIVNFWATWCRPCLKEIPALAAVYSEYKDKGVVMLGVLANDVETVELQDFGKATGINYPMVRADDEILAMFNYPSALPTTFIYDQAGKTHVVRRGQVHADELRTVLNQLLDRE